ncbi:cytidylate kinase [Bradyrhizobium sp. GM7.3]
MIIAIDGPAASGKGTLGKRLAHHYGYRHLDTRRNLSRGGLFPDAVRS